MSVEKRDAAVPLPHDDLALHQSSTRTSLRSISSGYSTPKWSYGSVYQNRNVESSGSGLLLAGSGHVAVASPEVVQNYLFPLSEQAKNSILENRSAISDILLRPVDSSEPENPLVVIAGPTFVSNAHQLKGCARWLGFKSGKLNIDEAELPASLTKVYSNPVQHLRLMLRANLSNYNFDYNDYAEEKLTSVMKFEIANGIPFCRALLEDIAPVCPMVGEYCDTISPQYLADLFSMCLVSSTLTESQLHRELASGSSYPVGFSTMDSHLPFDKETYGYRISGALDAMCASAQGHRFLSVTKVGTVAVVGTVGNDDTFVTLQVNQDLDHEHLKRIIDQVYAHKMNFKCPKIMLDVGKLTADTYTDKLNTVKHLISDSSVRPKIIGVVIDSGDDYIPPSFPVNFNHANNSDTEALTEQFQQLDGYFKRHRTASEEKLRTLEEVRESTYELLNNANSFIDELAGLCNH